MLKKIILITVILIVALGGTVFAEKYDDFKALLREMMEIMDTFADDIIEAENADEIVAAINTYHETITPLEPKMEKMDEKYSDIDDTNYPPELADVMEEFGETAEKLGTAMSKLGEYYGNEKVIQAMEKLE